MKFLTEDWVNMISIRILYDPVPQISDLGTTKPALICVSLH